MDHYGGPQSKRLKQDKSMAKRVKVKAKRKKGQSRSAASSNHHHENGELLKAGMSGQTRLMLGMLSLLSEDYRVEKLIKVYNNV